MTTPTESAIAGDTGAASASPSASASAAIEHVDSQPSSIKSLQHSKLLALEGQLDRIGMRINAAS